MVRLELVNENTFKKVVDMKVLPEQNQFVAPNVVSLAQAWLYRDNARPYAVCNDDEVVGFMMLDWDEDERTAGIWRFMIAPEHQHKGYGRKAMELALQMARESNEIDLLHLDYVEGNTIGRNLYASMGFCETGEIEDGEIIMTMHVTEHPKIGLCIADEDDLEEIEELIANEMKSGTTIPVAFQDATDLKRDIEEECITRICLYGETIGIAQGYTILLAKKYLSYLIEVKERLR